ncbi:MAG: DUF6340 family protein [Flavobacteriaceae bacterium]
MEPAPVDLSSNIKRIGIINESLVVDNTEVSSDLEAWVTYTDQQLSEAAKEAALAGLFDELSKDSRFDTILLLQNTKNELLGSNEIPWNSMEMLCKRYNVDALFALAFYETDTQISLKKTKIEQKDMLRERISLSGHEITLETLIENGWRIYDPFNKKILDEITLNNQIISKAKGEDPIRAFQAIENRTDSVLVISKETGSNFGLRLQPYAQTISRAYFAKGTENLEKADALAQSENWQSAAELWKLDLSHPKPKIRSRAYFNMAVVNELHGDLNTAIDWAAKSYGVYESKITEQYLDALNHRLVRHKQLEEQFLH